MADPDGTFTVSEDGQTAYSGDTVTVAPDGNTVTMTITPAGSRIPARVGGIQLSAASRASITTGDSKGICAYPRN